ncbi:thiopurine S-methyltransferase [Comamonas sp. NLF-1-9]|uniref:thiopurine S-methyltransferase n=1 Tax=Comamonas sp. NLF-1-9 TaxID=2853163 RepID=UPI001C48B14E|nr:thiopurine S-methyltransferase [Comamonas sp. NLF-1-9]QXL85201.1 thiopurine S-methyltransferase [Comamonas sp. NLF-1-9]
MDHAFWLQRWREGRIGFHQQRVLPLLQKHWPSLDLAQGSKVFVPLAGKSLDMLWLAEQGLRVLGVELSELAVKQFFAEHGLTPQVRHTPYGIHHVAGAIELICGDAFALDAQALADCSGLYDRAALVALPPELRARYVDELMARLPSGCRGLLVTLDYPQDEMQGPPFSVPEAEVEQRYAPRWELRRLEQRDLLADEPGFAARGLSAMATSVYRLQKQ